MIFHTISLVNVLVGVPSPYQSQRNICRFELIVALTVTVGGVA